MLSVGSSVSKNNLPVTSWTHEGPWHTYRHSWQQLCAEGHLWAHNSLNLEAEVLQQQRTVLHSWQLRQQDNRATVGMWLQKKLDDWRVENLTDMTNIYFRWILSYLFQIDVWILPSVKHPGRYWLWRVSKHTGPTFIWEMRIYSQLEYQANKSAGTLWCCQISRVENVLNPSLNTRQSWR